MKGLPVNTVLASIIIALIIIDCFQVSFGTFFSFYLPNALRPSGYKELTKIIKAMDEEIEPTSNFAADIEYFWKVMPEATDESICSESLERFLPLAKQYSQIDYDYYIGPIKQYREYIVNYRDEIYPKGSKQNYPLPRIWSQELLRKELEIKLEKHSELVTNEEFRRMRKTMVDIWTNVKRGMDGSEACILLRFAWRQMAPEIREDALEGSTENLKEMIEKLKEDEEKLKKFAKKDAAAIDKIRKEQERVASK